MTRIDIRVRSAAVILPGLVAGLLLLGGSRPGMAQQSEGRAPVVPLQTSINALMVALVDHAAHEIWTAGAAESLTERDWQTVEQHAIQLVSSGTLISLGGTGVADAGWVQAPAWQEWTQRFTDGALAALAAAKSTDQEAVDAAGGEILEACEGCHVEFKPEVPTEGIMHIPHYDD
jgi:hypothetical protein